MSMRRGQVRAGRRVGELAEASGLTVRTLHYYDEIGLLVASDRTSAGHRSYADDDVERLYRICLLRGLGFSLNDIREALDEPAWNLQAALTAHLHELDRRAEATARLRSRVSGLLTTLETTDAPQTADLLGAMEEMTELEPPLHQRSSILVYRDVEEAYDYLVRVFALGPGRLTRDEAGRVVHGEVQAGDGVMWLHPEREEYDLASPRSLGAGTSSVAVLVDDVDAHFRHTAARGAEIVYEPVDQPYGYREYGARDSESRLWSFMQPPDQE